MSNSEFAKGVQVVCVNDEWLSTDPGVTVIKPVLNGVYTIRDIFDWRLIFGLGEDAVTITVEEIVNPRHGPLMMEHSFYTWHFRPVKKTDISDFTAMLKDAPNKIHHEKETTPMRELEIVR